MEKVKKNKIGELIDYQVNSVVSKEILKSKSGSATLFAFDKGQGLSEHTAPFNALVYVFDGEAKINIAGNSYLLNSGETIIMPANKPHSLKAIKPFKMMLIMIRN